MKNKKIDLNIISESRNIILGISTLLIVFFHSNLLNFNELLGSNIISNVLEYLKRTGNIGVDIFLFISGMGLYFSLSKNNIKQYYKNRFIRIIPTFIIITLGFTILTKSYTIKDFFEIIFLISFFIKGKIDIWYIPFLITLYLIFPLIYKIIKKYNIYGLFIFLFITFSLNYLYMLLIPKHYKILEIATTRLPIFITGTYFGMKIYNKEKITKKIIPITIIIEIITPILLQITKHSKNYTLLSRYLYFPLAISSILLISLIYKHIKNKDNIIFKILTFLSNISLEMYLVYELVKLTISESNYINSYPKYYLICFIITIITSYILKLIINKVMNILTIKQNKRLT